MASAYAVFAQFLSLEVTALFKKNNIYINSPLGDFDRCLIENNMLSGRTLKVHISLLTVKLHQLEYIYIYTKTVFGKQEIPENKHVHQKKGSIRGQQAELWTHNSSNKLININL